MNEMRGLEKQKSQSGQALVEYILILGLAVAIILGLMNQFYRPFGNWMQDYMGQYLECLLDVGELPTVGGSSASGECNSKFQSFSITGGRPPIKDPNKSKDSEEDQGAGRTNSSSQGSSADSADSKSAAMANRASGRGGREPFTPNRRTGADGSGSLSDQNKLTEKLPESQFYKLKSSGGSVISGNEVLRPNGVNQSYIVSAKKNERRGEQTVEKLNLDEETAVEGKGKKIIVKPQERKIASLENDEPWSFSDYIKYGLIIIIVIALVLFLGGQMMQISKSMEK